jgi:hypothetical protein
MTGLRHDGMGGRYGGALDSYFRDVSRRLGEMGLTMMGGSTRSASLTSVGEEGGQSCERVAPAGHEFDQSNPSVG